MKNQKKILISLILATIVNVMDFNLVMVMLLNIIKSSQSLGIMLSHSTIFYSMALGIFEVGSALGSIILGSVSDIYGRKFIILSCVWLAAISYFLSLISVLAHLPQVFLLSRLLTGISTGSDSTLDAALIEYSEEGQLKSNINIIQAAVGIGFLLGPFVINMSSFYIKEPYIADRCCLLIGALLVTIVALIIDFLYVEKEQNVGNQNPWHAIKNSHFTFRSIIQNRYGRILFFLNFIFVIAQVLYDDNIFLVLVNRCAFSPVKLSRLSLIISAGYLFNNLVLQKYIRHIGSQKILYVTSFLMLILTGACLFMPHEAIFGITIFLQGIVQNTFQTHLLVIMAKQFKNAPFKGSMLGLVKGIDGFASIFSATAISSLVYVNDLLPFLISMIFLALLILGCSLLDKSSDKKAVYS